jgi:hypothetical protein
MRTVIHLYVTICMKLDPSMHIGLHLGFFGKTGVTAAPRGSPAGAPAREVCAGSRRGRGEGWGRERRGRLGRADEIGYVASVIGEEGVRGGGWGIKKFVRCGSHS